jgi:hypothetical protein
MLDHRNSLTAMCCHQYLQLLRLAGRNYHLRLPGRLVSPAALRSDSGHDARQTIGRLNDRLSGYPRRYFRTHGCAYFGYHGLGMLHPRDSIYALHVHGP